MEQCYEEDMSATIALRRKPRPLTAIFITTTGSMMR